MDPENEKELVTVIDALTKEKTILMIAHRLKSKCYLDFDSSSRQNRARKGKRKELMQQKGIYRTLC